jgi:hypothetical protein
MTAADVKCARGSTGGARSSATAPMITKPFAMYCQMSCEAGPDFGTRGLDRYRGLTGILFAFGMCVTRL